MKNLPYQIAAKLSAEGLNKDNYTLELAKKALSGCVSADRLITFLTQFECDVLAILNTEAICPTCGRDVNTYCSNSFHLQTT
jgi:hypothetical protein